MIKAISRLVPAGFLYKAIPSFWKKSLAVIGLLAALIAVFVVFNGGLEDGVFTKKAVVESENAHNRHKDAESPQTDYKDYGYPAPGGASPSWDEPPTSK